MRLASKKWATRARDYAALAVNNPAAAKAFRAKFRRLDKFDAAVAKRQERSHTV